MDHEVACGKLTAFRQIAARVAAGKAPFAEPIDPRIGGLNVAQWFEVFHDTHTATGMGGFLRTDWPEEGGYAEQPAVVITAFRLVTEAILTEHEQTSGK